MCCDCSNFFKKETVNSIVYLLIFAKEISKMKQSEIETLAREAAKGIKTEKDLCDFSRMLKKVTVETVRNTELEEHSA